MAAFLAERLGYTTLRQYCSLIERSNTLDRDINTLHRFIDCDRALRTVFMKWIGVFESQFKARYANAMAREHGPFAHRDPSNFKNSEHFDDFLETYSREFSYKLEAGNESVKTAFERDGDLPIWRAVEILPLGALSKMYRNSVSENVRFKVADAFRVKYGMLSSWLRTISEIRNRCAHFEPFVCKPVTFKPKRMPGITADNGSIFYIVLILEQLTQTDALHEDIRTTGSVTKVGVAPRSARAVADCPSRSGTSPENPILHYRQAALLSHPSSARTTVIMRAACSAAVPS